MQLSLSTTFIALFFSLTTSAYAAGHLEIRAAVSKCSADNCYRAAVASSAKPGAASASADCASFLRVTATPCPTTTTITTLGASSTSTTTVGGDGVVRQAILKRVAADPTCTGPSTVTPTAVPAYASSACGPSASASARYSSACSCKGQTQSVIIAATPTSTQSVAVIATPALCGNQGVKFYYYKDNSYGNFNSPNNYGEFDPQKYDNIAPDAQGFTDSGTIGPIQYSGAGDTTQIYGQTLQSHDYVVDHQTYFVAPIAGTYTFAVNNIDDLAVLYTGSNAYNGYANGNEDYRAGYYPSSNGVVSSTHDLTQGQYFPLRLFYVDAPGRANLDFTVTGPAPFDQASSLKSFFVQSSCDGTTAPKFPTLPKGQSSPSTGPSD